MMQSLHRPHLDTAEVSNDPTEKEFEAILIFDAPCRATRIHDL